MKNIIRNFRASSLFRLYLQIWNLDLQYRSILTKIDKYKSRIKTVLSDNSIHQEITSVYEDKRHFFYRYFIFIVAFIDYCLAYIVISEYTEYIPYLPVFLTALIMCIAIVTVEYTLALFKIPISRELMENDKKVNRKNSLMAVFSLVFISVLPLMSLSELSGSLSNAELLGSLGNEGDQSIVRLAKVKAYFKYISLAIMSFILHLYIISYPKHILSGLSRSKVKSLVKNIENDIEEEEKYKSDIERKIILSLVEFDAKMAKHIRSYGKYVGLPPNKFSRPVNMLRQQVIGKSQKERA